MVCGLACDAYLCSILPSQVVVDLPEKRRNRSPQRQAPPPPPPQPAGPTEPAVPAEPAKLHEASAVVSSQGVQRPYSSRPEGSIGWVEPDSPQETLATFAAAAQDSAAAALSVETQGEVESLGSPAVGYTCVLLLPGMSSNAGVLNDANGTMTPPATQSAGLCTSCYAVSQLQAASSTHAALDYHHALQPNKLALQVSLALAPAPVVGKQQQQQLTQTQAGPAVVSQAEERAAAGGVGEGAGGWGKWRAPYSCPAQPRLGRMGWGMWTLASGTSSTGTSSAAYVHHTAHLGVQSCCPGYILLLVYVVHCDVPFWPCWTL